MVDKHIKECEFCAEYKLLKELNKNTKPTAEYIKTLDYKYYVAMVDTTVINGKERFATTHRKVKLNYCPVCGRKLIE